MYRVEIEVKPKKWKKDTILFRDLEDAEQCMMQFWEKGINARIVEEGLEEE